ncbi:hypothetical protein Angca_001992, partial [Angiostrongylus cantonensis]
TQAASRPAGHTRCVSVVSLFCAVRCAVLWSVCVCEEASQPASKRACFAVCTTRMMLSPIITKDMKLFPSRPLPAGIKNVRSRAQSLDHFNQMQSSGSARGRVVAIKPRSSQSTGNLPAFAASSTSGSMTSRSPPKTIVHRKTTLTAIQEGVEMGHNHHHHPNPNANALRDDRQTESQKDGKLSSATRKNSKKTTKNGKENESTARNDHCKFFEGTDAAECRREKKQRKSVVKWITSAFRKSKDKDSSDHSNSNSS